jgi:hypothetical protein
MDETMRGRRANDEAPLEQSIPPEHMAIEERAKAYRRRTHPWLQACECAAMNEPADPKAVIAWFHTLISARIHRAVRGLANDCPQDRDWPPDHDGCAKVALLGIERSQAAWLELVERRIVTDAEAAPFIAELVWLGEALERVFPGARAFVRPAFDEPEEVSRLLAG